MGNAAEETFCHRTRHVFSKPVHPVNTFFCSHPPSFSSASHSSPPHTAVRRIIPAHPILTRVCIGLQSHPIHLPKKVSVNDNVSFHIPSAGWSRLAGADLARQSKWARCARVPIWSQGRVNPYILAVFIHVPSVAGSLLEDIPSFIARCKWVFAVLNVPKGTRPALALIESVVSRRRRAPVASLPGSCRRRPTSSSPGQWSRASSSPMNRSALASALSRRNSPAWGSPSLPSIRSHGSWRNASPPKHPS